MTHTSCRTNWKGWQSDWKYEFGAKTSQLHATWVSHNFNIFSALN